MGDEDFTLGVEEEYPIVDPHNRELRGASTNVLPAARTAVGDDVKPRRRCPHELFVAANRRASRYGREDDLVDVEERRTVRAADLISRLMEVVRPALDEDGDWDTVVEIVNRTVERGPAAARHRAAYAQSGRLEDVVDLILDETSQGVS